MTEGVLAINLAQDQRRKATWEELGIPTESTQHDIDYNTEKLKRLEAERKAYLKKDLAAEYPVDHFGLDAEMRYTHEHWGKLCDLEVGAKKLSAEKKEVANQWLHSRVKYSYDTELVARAKALIKRLKWADVSGDV